MRPVYSTADDDGEVADPFTVIGEDLRMPRINGTVNIAVGGARVFIVLRAIIAGRRSLSILTVLLLFFFLLMGFLLALRISTSLSFLPLKLGICS